MEVTYDGFGRLHKVFVAGRVCATIAGDDRLLRQTAEAVTDSGRFVSLIVQAAAVEERPGVYSVGGGTWDGRVFPETRFVPVVDDVTGCAQCSRNFESVGRGEVVHAEVRSAAVDEVLRTGVSGSVHDNDGREMQEGGVCEDTRVGSGGTCGSEVRRGKNYLKNKAKREAAKRKRSEAGRGNATRTTARPDGTVDGRVGGTFSKCAEEVQKRLAESRAERYILENEAAIRKLKAMDHEKAAQKQAKKLDTELKFLDGQLNGDYSLCPPGRVMGWAKTLVSKSSGSKSSSDKSSPSLSKGSTSPSSSVSQNERRLEKLCKELEQKLEVSEKEKEKLKSQFKVVRNMTRPVMTDQDRYFGRDHDFESGNEDDYYY